MITPKKWDIHDKDRSMGIQHLPETPEGKNHLHTDCNATITCKDCLDVLNMVIDHEEKPTDAFNQHLKDCLPCLEKYNLDKAIKEVLQNKCKNTNPPQDLINSIKDRILKNAGS